MIKQLLVLAGAGALGTLLRYYVTTTFVAKNFPWPTLSVNVLGSIAMGVIYVLIYDKAIFPEAARPIIMTAFLGAFTTFSAFSLEVFVFLEKGDWLSAMAYILGSVILCVGMLSLSIYLTRAVL